MKNGLADSHIRAIQQDKMGNIWVSTYTGIACWNAYQQKFHNYDYQDGVPMGGFVEGSATITPDGTIYFGSLHGVCYFNPQTIEANETVSSIEIISCESFNTQEGGRKSETMTPDNEGFIRLPYDRNTFRISFSTADYAQNGQVEYAYMMEGMDNSWYNTEDDNTITFRNVTPGKYTFKIKARLKTEDGMRTTLFLYTSLSILRFGEPGMPICFIHCWH